MSKKKWVASSLMSWIRTIVPREVHYKFKDAAAIYGVTVWQFYTLVLSWLVHDLTGESLAQMMFEESEKQHQATLADTPGSEAL